MITIERQVAFGLTALVAVGVLTAPTNAQISYTDDFYSGNHWLTSFDPAYPVETAATGVLPGGIGDPSSGYHVTVVQGYSFQSEVRYRASHFNLAIVYSPTVFGPITSLTWDVWFKTQVGGHVLNLVAYQNDSIYLSPQGEGASGQYPHWQHHARTIDPSTLTRIAGTGQFTLDTSPTASPIIFGYMNYNDTGLRDAQGTQLQGGIFDLDLYHLSITSIPEPQRACCLLGAAALALVIRHRRHPTHLTTHRLLR